MALSRSRSESPCMAALSIREHFCSAAGQDGSEPSATMPRPKSSAVVKLVAVPANACVSDRYDVPSAILTVAMETVSRGIYCQYRQRMGSLLSFALKETGMSARPRGKAPACQERRRKENLARVKTYKRLKTLIAKCFLYSKEADGAGVAAVFVTPTGAIHA